LIVGALAVAYTIPLAFLSAQALGSKISLGLTVIGPPSLVCGLLLLAAQVVSKKNHY
jgi:hypothetical protein